MYADMDAGMTYRDALAETVKRLVPNAPADEIERLTEHFENKFYNRRDLRVRGRRWPGRDDHLPPDVERHARGDLG